MIKPKKDWTVLDMGCGAGALALPLAENVKYITAVDFSEAMLDFLDSSIQKKKIKNIKTIHASWEDDWEKAGIGKKDFSMNRAMISTMVKMTNFSLGFKGPSSLESSRDFSTRPSMRSRSVFTTSKTARSPTS